MTHPNGHDEDEFTELVDANIPRVDLVGKGANGMPFLVAKSDGSGIVPANLVRDLITPTAPAPAPVRDDVTITGSPAAVMKMMWEATQRQKAAEVAKADPDAAERKHDAATGAAMPDGSYPIENTAQLADAIHAVGRGGADHDAIRRHIITRAHSLGAATQIPDNWNSDGSLKEGQVSKDTAEVVKAASDEAPVEVTDIIDTPTGGSTAESMPGSPDWEELDAATAERAIGVLGRAKAAIDWLVTREETEAVANDDPDDADNAWELSDACSAIDCAIRTLGAFAAGEKLEAGLASEMEAVTKAADSAAEPLAVLEQLVPVVKAGRVLSSANEARIKSASESLSEVLATLPAPIEDGLAVAKSKEEPVTEPTPTEVAKTEAAAAAAEGTALEQATLSVAEAREQVLEPVEKAAKPLVIAYNANGKAIGLIDPEKMQPIADDASAAASDDDEPADDQPADPAPAASADAPADTPPPAAPAGGPIEPPAPPAVPDDVTKTITDPVELMKSILAGPLQDAIERAVAPLQERVAKMEAQPMPGGPMLNGAEPGPRLPVIPDSGIPAGDQLAELRKQADAETDPVKKAAALQAVAEQAMKAALHLR